MARDRTKVIGDYFLAHPDTELSVQRVAQDTGYSKAEASQAIYGLRTRKEFPLPIVQVRAQVYRLDARDLKNPATPPPIAPEPTYFEVIGKNVTGKFILRGDNNLLYWAEPLEF